jgi:hypothetical protein
MFILEIDLKSSHFSWSNSKYLTTRRRQRRARKGGALKIRSGRPWHLELLTWSSLSAPSLPRASTRASHSYSLIYIRQYLLRFQSFCRVIHSHHQAHLGYSDHDVHPPAIHQSTKFVFIGIVPQPRFIWWLPRDRGQCLWELHKGQPPHPYGGPKRGSVPQHLQWVSHYWKIRDVWCLNP